MSLIVTGSIGIDTIETHDGQKADNVLGGSSIYFAAGASFFTPVRLVAAVGEDFPAAFTAQFSKFKVDTSGLEVRKGSKTFRWHGRYRENMNDRDTLSVELNVLAEALPPVPEAFKDSQFVFLANTHPAGQMALLDQFPKRRLAVADSMDLWIEIAQPELKKLLAQLDGFVLNDSEARLLTGESNAVKAADKVLELMGGKAGSSQRKFVIVKKGEHGAILRHTEGTVVLPAYPSTQVKDPTGAGDTFASGFMGYIASQNDTSFATLRQALAYGTVVASFTIEKFSVGRLEEITRADIDARLKEYKTLVGTGH